MSTPSLQFSESLLKGSRKVSDIYGLDALTALKEVSSSEAMKLAIAT